MLVFVDESGHPIPSDNTDRPVLSAICIRETDIRELTSDIHRIKIDVYGKADDEIKSTNLVTKRIINKGLTKNKGYVDRIISLLPQYNIKIFAVIMERPDYTPYIKEGFLPKQYYHLLKKIELYCKKYNCSMAMIIFDEQDHSRDQKISVAFNNFLYKSNLGRSFEKILEVPLFVDSKITVGIQIADLVAGILRHYYEEGLNEHNPVDDYQRWLYELYRIIKQRTEDIREPVTNFLQYGFFLMNKAGFPSCLADYD